MKISDDIIAKIKSITPDDLELHGVITPAKSTAKVNGYQTYLCPSKGCTNGTGSSKGKAGSGIVVYLDNDGYSYHCFSCESHFDNINLLAEYYGLDSVQDFPEIIERTCTDFNIFCNNFTTNEPPRKAPIAQKSVENDSAFKDRELELIHSDISQAKSNLPNFIERCGGTWRGLKLETLQKFGCGYLPNWIHPKTRVNFERGEIEKLPRGTARVIIPTDNHYLACMLEQDRNAENKSYQKMHAGNKELFNLSAIKNDCRELTVVEGEIDAMSLSQIGVSNVVALGGTGYDSFLREMDKIFFDNQPRIFILRDNDKPSLDSFSNLRAELIKRGYSVAVAAFASDDVPKVDANDMLKKGERALIEAIGEISKNPDLHKQFAETYADILANKDNEVVSSDTQAFAQDTSFSDYFKNQFWLDVANIKNYTSRKSGFSNIDEKQIFRPGLYVLGALPAAGKTTFAWQMAENFARAGLHSIYCSYEMSKFELYTKSVARALYKRNPKSTLTATDIASGATTPALNSVIEDFARANLNLRVMRLSNETVDALLDKLRPYCTDKGNAPVIFLDYLQIAPSSKDSTKSGVDDTVRKLKDFQQKTSATFIVISSFNRDNYTKPASYESYKESGGIEYSSDVIWALQLEAITKITDTTKIINIRLAVEEAKRERPRKIQLVCLKNRFGSNYDCYFNYYPANDYFEPCDAQVNNQPANNDDDDDD